MIQVCPYCKIGFENPIEYEKHLREHEGDEEKPKWIKKH